MRRLPELLHTSRLTLRRWTADDAEVLSTAILESLDHLRPWMWWAASEPVSLRQRVETLEQFTRDWEAGGDVTFRVELAFGGEVEPTTRRDAAPDGTVVGGCGLHRRRGPNVLEIGYWLHVDHTGRGYATEVAAALTVAGLAEPGIGRIEIHHDRANTASRRVPERLGFTLLGEHADGARAPGEEGVDCVWSIDTACDWPPSGPPIPRSPLD